jgi:addiction module HigA family antidote
VARSPTAAFGMPPSGDAVRAPARAEPRQAPRGVRVRRPPHPGRLLERLFLKPLALSQSEAARRLGVSRRRLHELVHGQRRMSPDTALRCAELFGLAASHWLGLQSDWDGWHAWQARRHLTY